MAHVWITQFTKTTRKMTPFSVRPGVDRSVLKPVGHDGKNLSWRNIAIWGVIKHKIMEISMWKSSFLKPLLLCWAMRQTAIMVANGFETNILVFLFVCFSTPMISGPKIYIERWNLEQTQHDFLELQMSILLSALYLSV